MAETESCHLGSLNLPSQTKKDGPKSKLLPHPKRCTEAVAAADSHNITILCLQELASECRKTIDSQPNWQLLTSTNTTKPNGKQIGNGIAYRGDVWRLIDDLRLTVEREGQDDLKQIVALFDRKDGSDGQVVVMCVHHPTRNDDDGNETDRKRCRSIENDYSDKLVAAGFSVLLGGDFNDGAALDTMGSDRWKAGAHSQVDWVMGRKDTNLKFPEDGKVDTSVHLTVTDHPGMPHVKATFPIKARQSGLPPK